MKLVTCLHEGKERVGALMDGVVVFLPYPDMNTLIETASVAELQTVPAECGVPLEDVTLLAPIPRPRQDVICLGMNYTDHAEESARFNAGAFTKEEAVAVYFSKRVNEATAPEAPVESHQGLVDSLDYEVELAVIIGKAARDVKAEDAKDYVFGYTVLNDVSARNLQTRHLQWYFGKSLDGFTPMGPCILTADETAFPPALEVSSQINGELRQHSNTERLITSIPAIIAELSRGMTLLPGTIIATGTPAGVGLGFNPPQYMKPGDIMECTIEKIGTLRNPIV